MTKIKQKHCTQCNMIHDTEDIKRQYGKESAVYLGGFHSAECYTKYLTNKKQTYIPINWLPTGDGFLPNKSKDKNEIEGSSDRVLIFCKDGTERFGRYYHGHLRNFWNVEGCTGQAVDFVTHFAYLKEPE